MLQLPTGAGKTMIAAAIVEMARAKGNRVIFTVPALSLVDQTVKAFWNVGVRDVGVIQGWHEMTNPNMPVQVASVQTLMKRQIPEAALVIVDEAHRWFNFYGKWMMDEAWAKVPFIGLSATPWTQGLGAYYDDLIVPTTPEDLIEDGYLSPFKVFAPSHPDLAGVRTVAGDYHEGDLGAAMNKAPLVADVVDTWLKKGEGRSTFCFAVDRAHAKHLQERFQAAGVATDYIDAYTDSKDREAVRQRFQAGETRVVVNVGCLTTGVDWDCRCIVMARPTKSEMLFVQIIGRGLRPAEGKDHCLILDHSDNHLRLGFVTDIAHDQLDNGRERASRKNDKIALPKECPQCTFLRPPRVATCPSCGFKAKPVSNIECEDGELRELKAGKADKATKQRWYSMLIHVGRSRGYKPKWADNQYRQRFGVWPRGLSSYGTPPDAEVLGYVQHSLIRFAKQRSPHEHRPS
jgi:superfamily II DNA or RNA helicase